MLTVFSDSRCSFLKKQVSENAVCQYIKLKSEKPAFQAAGQKYPGTSVRICKNGIFALRTED
jgi:hypothetical protein